MKKVYKALICDADGTLVDTTDLIVKGYIQTLSENGYEDIATEKHIKDSIGGTVAHSLATMLEVAEEVPEVQNMVVYHDTIQDAHPEWIRAYPKVSETLCLLKDTGLKLCLFTSGSIYQVERNFKAVGMNVDTLFDALVTADDNVTSKPSPEGLLLALEKIGITHPEDVAYVGDHDVDIQAAKAAQVGLSIGVSHGFHSFEELQTSGVDEIVSSLDEIVSLLTSGT